jgi:CBS-domain-containing membrane protein
MERVMKAAEVMTHNVFTIEPDASILQAIRIMLQRRISGLPVVDTQGSLVGIVTEGDLLRRSETGTQRRRPRWLEFLLGPGRMANEYVHTSGRRIAEVMSTSVYAISEETPVQEIVQLMEKHQVKRLPVLRDGKLVGVVSRANLLRALASVAIRTPTSSTTDTAIREHLLAEIDKQAWAPAALVNVVVRDGIVHLWGSITDDRQRQGLQVLAENTPGVKAVQDHLVWIEPMSGMAILPPDEEVTAKAS